MTTRTAIFRFDAGASIGLGHAVRCGALADVLVEGGWRVGIAVRPETVAAVPKLTGRYDVAVLRTGDEASEVRAHWKAGCDLLVVDHYGRGAEFEGSLRSWAKLVLALDDAPSRPHTCDLLVDPAARPGDGTYDRWLSVGATRLLGPKYALLRHSFRRLREASLARRQSVETVRRLMIGLGATDPVDLTSRVVEAASTVLPEARIDVVLGAAAPHLDRARRIVVGRRNARLLVDPPDVAEIMSAADLAIGAAGSTSFERACLGLPGIAVVVASNQESIARLLRERDAATVVDGRAGDPTPVIAEALLRLAGDTGRLRRMSAAGAAIADGLGGERVREAVESRLADRPSP